MKIFAFVASILFALFLRECLGQSNPCGAASFTFNGNFQNQQVRLDFIGVDGSLYNTLANNLAGNYADPQAAYLYDAIMNSNNPIASVVAQVVVNSNGVAQDGPSTFVVPGSSQFRSMLQEALVWSYMQYWYSNLDSQSEMNLEQTDFQQVCESQWQQQLGIDLATAVNVATIIGPITEDLSSVLGDSEAATQVGDFVSLYQETSGGFSSLQSAFGTNSSSILNILEKYNVVTGQNYTSAQLVVGMANLNPSQLAQFESDLYAAAYPGNTLKPDAQQYVTTFLENAGAGAEQLGISAAASGAEAFYEAYALAQFPASDAAEAAVSQAGSYFADGLPALAAWSAASTVMQVYVTPQADILQDMVYCQDTLTTNLFPEFNSLSSEMMGNNGSANFDIGVANAADIEAISSFEALWCNLGAQEESNEVVQTQLSSYLLLGSAFNGRAASMYNTLAAANSMSQNLANQSSAIPAPSVSGLSQANGVLGDEFTISGVSLCNAVAVYFNNTPAWFQVNSSTSISTVAPAGTGTVDIRVVGPGGVSQITANDEFTYGTASPSPTNKVISLTGNLTFGNVTIETSAQRTLTISNTGNTNLTVSSISCPTGFSGSWSGTIPAGGSTNVIVTFSPTLATTYGGNVTVNSDATSGNNTISISGTGVNAPSGATRIIDVVPASNLAFGNVPVNIIALRVVTIVNEGNTNLDISGISYPPGFSGNWSGTIFAGNQVSMTVSFSPTALTSYGGTMTVNSDATSGVNTLPISGTGVSPPSPSTNRIAVSAFDTLHSFAGSDGNNPLAPLVQGSNGGFYGTTYRGGTNGVGSVFRIDSDGTFLSLYSFRSQNNLEGENPSAALVQGTDGNFYGTTQGGGLSAVGGVFSITSYGMFTPIYMFTNQVTGGVYWFTGDGPWNLVEGNDGKFYGTTESGGIGEYGNIFRISPNGAFANLYSFNGNDGQLPYGGLVLGSDGSFYGSTSMGGTNGGYGTIFRITPDGTFTSLFSFSGTNGSTPEGNLVEGNDGNFYGTTESGGNSGFGTIFQITTNGILTTLYSFSGGSDGGNPQAGLEQATDGNFYGTTSSGGMSNNGTIFRITPDGKFVTFHWFQGDDGRKPVAAMMQGEDGNLYGTTENGGTNGNFGTVFRIVIPPIVQPLVKAGNTIKLTWSSVPGQIYQVQYTSDLTSGNWSNVTSQLSAQFSTTTVSDAILVTNQQRFYRVVEYPEAW